MTVVPCALDEMCYAVFLMCYEFPLSPFLYYVHVLLSFLFFHGWDTLLPFYVRVGYPINKHMAVWSLFFQYCGERHPCWRSIVYLLLEQAAMSRAAHQIDLKFTASYQSILSVFKTNEHTLSLSLSSTAINKPKCIVTSLRLKLKE